MTYKVEVFKGDKLIYHANGFASNYKAWIDGLIYLTKEGVISPGSKSRTTPLIDGVKNSLSRMIENNGQQYFMIAMKE